MNNNFLFKLKMTTILKVVLCSLFIFFLSCSKFEEEQKQTQIVPNINEAQAVIGKQNWFENHVNIEDFKNIKVEDDITHQKHEKALSTLLALNSFPSASSKEDLLRISRQIYYTFGRPANRSHFNSGKFLYYMMVDMRTEPYVECFLKQYFNEETKTIEYQLYLPKKVYHLSYKERTSRVYGGTFDYVRREVPVSVYCSLTGIPRNLIEDLRVVTRQEREFSYWYYQMPYKDNYLDYQNDTQEVNSLDDLKKFIKKGSFIFVFDKPREDLDKFLNFKELFDPTDDKLGFENWGHMMIVGKWYKDDNLDGYNHLSQYKILSNYYDFKNIQAIFQNSFKETVSFTDYLRHFVFIEAQKDPVKNRNKLQGFQRDNGVMLTSGNDERFQEYIKKATCVAVVNLNDGYNYSHPNLVDNMIFYAYNQLGKPYSSLQYAPTGRDNDIENHYCSGLVFYSFLNEKVKPSIRLLLPKHTSFGYYRGRWYIPRTVCNSPFVYTRVWYKK